MLTDIEHLLTLADSAMLVLCVGGAIGLFTVRLLCRRTSR